MNDFDIRIKYEKNGQRLAIYLGDNRVEMMSGARNIEDLFGRIIDVIIDNFAEKKELK